MLDLVEPLKLAENIALLDVLLGGRKLNIGVGRGFAAREFNALRIPSESRGRMQECLLFGAAAVSCHGPPGMAFVRLRPGVSSASGRVDATTRYRRQQRDRARKKRMPR